LHDPPSFPTRRSSDLLGRPVAIGRAKVADEAGDDVLEPRVGERLQERAGVALAEERPRVRDSKAVAAPILQAGKVVEVRAVQDRSEEHTSELQSRGHL